MFGLMEKKQKKNYILIQRKQIFKLKEYDNLPKILKSFKKQNYLYISHLSMEALILSIKKVWIAKSIK
jgi:hypothetical protein